MSSFRNTNEPNSPKEEKPEDIFKLFNPDHIDPVDEWRSPIPAGLFPPSVPAKPVPVIERHIDEPSIVCSKALIAWRVCTDKPTTQACRDKLCSTPATANVRSCEKIREVCGIQTRQIKQDETPEVQSVSELEEVGAVSVPKDQVVNLFTSPNYVGGQYFIAVEELWEHQCKQVPYGVEIASLQLHDKAYDYWCRIFGTRNCNTDGLVYADLPGTTEYNVSDLRKSWFHSMESIKCYMGAFEVTHPGAS